MLLIIQQSCLRLLWELSAELLDLIYSARIGSFVTERYTSSYQNRCRKKRTIETQANAKIQGRNSSCAVRVFKTIMGPLGDATGSAAAERSWTICLLENLQLDPWILWTPFITPPMISIVLQTRNGSQNLGVHPANSKAGPEVLQVTARIKLNQGQTQT